MKNVNRNLKSDVFKIAHLYFISGNEALPIGQSVNPLKWIYIQLLSVNNN